MARPSGLCETVMYAQAFNRCGLVHRPERPSGRGRRRPLAAGRDGGHRAGHGRVCAASGPHAGADPARAEPGAAAVRVRCGGEPGHERVGGQPPVAAAADQPAGLPDPRGPDRLLQPGRRARAPRAQRRAAARRRRPHQQRRSTRLMGTGHSHSGSAAVAHKGRLTAVLAITLTILAAEVAGALLSGSLTLLADAGHMLMDAGGIALALLAISFGQRSPSQARTFGYLRLEILAAAVNALLLFAVSVFVIVEALRRLIHPPQV